MSFFSLTLSRFIIDIYDKECMCNWQNKKGCVGSGCQFAYGLAWYHYSCKDCQCVPEPK